MTNWFIQDGKVLTVEGKLRGCCCGECSMALQQTRRWYNSQDGADIFPVCYSGGTLSNGSLNEVCAVWTRATKYGGFPPALIYYAGSQSQQQHFLRTCTGGVPDGVAFRFRIRYDAPYPYPAGMGISYTLTSGLPSSSNPASWTPCPAPGVWSAWLSLGGWDTLSIGAWWDCATWGHPLTEAHKEAIIFPGGSSSFVRDTWYEFD